MNGCCEYVALVVKVVEVISRPSETGLRLGSSSTSTSTSSSRRRATDYRGKALVDGMSCDDASMQRFAVLVMDTRRRALKRRVSR